MDKLSKCTANFTPLSPITFLQRAAQVYANRTSIIYRSTQFNWAQTFHRCRRLASSLHKLSIAKNDVVSILAPNIPAMYEVHFAVPMAGAVLNTINIRLDSANVAQILDHSEAKLLFVDYQYLRLAVDALRRLMDDSKSLPLVVVIDDVDTPTGVRLGELEYECLIRTGDPDHPPYVVEDEWDPVSLSYTSGTTSAPKGVVYSHRGAYLSTLSLLLQWGVGGFPVYMWSLPMFHCNGWTFTWGIAARGGTNVCIRNTGAADMYHAISTHKVTHMCCAPIVFNIILEATPEQRRPIHGPIHVLTGGAPPPAALLDKIQGLGFNVTHAYGLTEATGPAMVCEWQSEWNSLPSGEQSQLKQRQGVSVLTLSDADVVDPETMVSVKRDGKSIGEIVLRGSSIMRGYYKNEAENAKAFKDGWFWTGDVGVVHTDGYVEIKDRSKDVIISGGENISSVEVENVLYMHRDVVEAAVVAMPHPFWGESPCAFVTVRKDSQVREEDVIDHCRCKLPKFMVPKKIVFKDGLPKTNTGKILKFQLRELAKESEQEHHIPSSSIANKTEGSRINPSKNQDRPQQQILAISRL